MLKQGPAYESVFLIAVIPKDSKEHHKAVTQVYDYSLLTSKVSELLIHLLGQKGLL